MIWYYNVNIVNTWICEVFSYSYVVLHFILQCLIKVFTLVVSHFLCFLYVAIMIVIVYLSAHLTLVYKKALVLMSLLVWLCATLLKVFIISKSFFGGVPGSHTCWIISYTLKYILTVIPHSWTVILLEDMRNKLKFQNKAWVSSLWVDKLQRHPKQYKLLPLLSVDHHN